MTAPRIQYAVLLPICFRSFAYAVVHGLLASMNLHRFSIGSVFKLCSKFVRSVDDIIHIKVIIHFYC